MIRSTYLFFSKLKICGSRISECILPDFWTELWRNRYLHEEHVPGVVRPPVDSEGLLLHHPTSERLQVNVISMLVERFKKKFVFLVWHWSFQTGNEPRVPSTSILQSVTSAYGQFYKFVFLHYILRLHKVYQLHTRLPSWSSSWLMSWLQLRPMWHLPRRRRALRRASFLLTRTITMNATMLYSITPSRWSSSYSRRFFSESPRDL